MIEFDWLESVALQENDFDIGDKTALIPDFIFSESITLIYSPPKQGKTWLAYSMGLEIIKKKEVEQLIYIDMDNSLSTLKERGINQSFITKSKIKYITRVKLQVEPIDFLKKIANSATLGAYEGMVFFLDTIKDFVDTDSKTQASEFMKYFEALLQQKGLTHYWTYPRSPKMNAHNERFNRTIQEQFVDFYEDLLFTDIDLFNQYMADWLIDYNTIIPHHSLNMKSPVQYLFEYHNECHMLWTNTHA